MKRLKIAAMSAFCAVVLGVLAWGGQQPAPSQNVVMDAVKKAAVEKTVEKPNPLALDNAAKAEIKKLVNSFDTLGEELAVAQEQVKVLTDLRNKKLQLYREFLVREAGKRGLDPAGYLVDTDKGELVAIPTPPKNAQKHTQPLLKFKGSSSRVLPFPRLITAFYGRPYSVAIQQDREFVALDLSMLLNGKYTRTDAFTDCDSRRIVLHPDRVRSQEVSETLLHEVLHAAFSCDGSGAYMTQHEFVYALAPRLDYVFRHSPELVEWYRAQQKAKK